MLSNKLDFLEVSRHGVSDLKILLIEMEVSPEDWLEYCSFVHVYVAGKTEILVKMKVPLSLDPNYSWFMNNLG